MLRRWRGGASGGVRGAGSSGWAAVCFIWVRARRPGSLLRVSQIWPLGVSWARKVPRRTAWRRAWRMASGASGDSGDSVGGDMPRNRVSSDRNSSRVTARGAWRLRCSSHRPRRVALSSARSWISSSSEPIRGSGVGVCSVSRGKPAKGISVFGSGLAFGVFGVPFGGWRIRFRACRFGDWRVRFRAYGLAIGGSGFGRVVWRLAGPVSGVWFGDWRGWLVFLSILGRGRRSRSGPGCRGIPVAGFRWGRCGVWRR